MQLLKKDENKTLWLSFEGGLICLNNQANEMPGITGRNFRTAIANYLESEETVDLTRAENTKIALSEWIGKTNWVQEQIHTFPVHALGMHRADVMHEEIQRLRRALADVREALPLLDTALVEYIANSRDVDEEKRAAAVLKVLRAIPKATS